MKVCLAGYNIDADVIEELKSVAPKRQDVTPETISAAYARISRDPRPVNELRADARREVEKSRKSNTAIIFGLGHSSVAEHATFNFDVIDVSRYAMEELEKFRLCSFTEKSQRYITLNKGFVLPAEIRGSAHEQNFIGLIGRQIQLYEFLFEKLKDYIFEKHPDLAKEEKNKNLLEGWAKEDARYITSLATHSQCGMTVNARNLEKMLRRFASHPLREIQDLGKALHLLVKDITPSIIKYPESNDFDRDTTSALQAQAEKLFGRKLAQLAPIKECRLIEHTHHGDEKIIAAILERVTALSFDKCLKLCKGKAKKELFRTAVEKMKFYDQPIREFEMGDLTYELKVSGACFGQLKRHRMLTLISQRYQPNLGLLIPPSVKAIGYAKEFQKVAEDSAALYEEIKKDQSLAADYILTNAHQRKVLCKTNLRELYHMSRMREDAHAQWDIKNITSLMVKQAKKRFPITTKLIGGKDLFGTVYSQVVGK